MLHVKLTLFFCVLLASSTLAAPPNFLLIFTDDQGINDVGCYGSEIPTPHIDSLAKDGLRFTQWYSASSICTPSRYGLLTGRNPARSRDQLLSALMFLSDDDKSRGLQSNETTFAATLQKHGYGTVLIGKWHLGHGKKGFLPTRHGFDLFYGHTGGCVDFFTMRYGNTPDWYEQEELVDVTGYATDIITDRAVEYLNKRDAAQPFFLYLSYNAPHFGKGWNDGDGKTVNQLQPPPNDLARVAKIKDITRRKYAAKVVNLDDAIGRVLKSLETQGLAEDTLVIFITDHGGDPKYGGSNKPFRGSKATMFEGGIRVPCLMRWPKVISAGRESDVVTSSLDVAPTLCALAVVKDSTAFDGVDLSSLLRGEKTELGPRELFWETGAHNELGRGRWRAIRQGDWKYVSDSEGKEYLFNIASDKLEQTNLRDTNHAKLRELRTRAEERAAAFRG